MHAGLVNQLMACYWMDQGIELQSIGAEDEIMNICRARRGDEPHALHAELRRGGRVPRRQRERNDNGTLSHSKDPANVVGRWFMQKTLTSLRAAAATSNA